MPTLTRTKSFLAGGMIWLLQSAAMAGAIPVQILAQAFPPLQYESSDGQGAGFAHDYVLEALRETGGKMAVSTSPVQFMPLKRALSEAVREPNTLVLSVARTPERENQFIWIEEVAPYNIWVYKRKEQKLPGLAADSLIGRGLRIGVQDGSNFHEWLKQRGVGSSGDNNTLDLVAQNDLNFRKLQLGRIDLLAQPSISYRLRMKEQDIPLAAFEPAFRIAELSQPLWLVASKNSDPRFIEQLRRCLDKLKANGRWQALQQTYQLDAAAKLPN